ncbi:MAG: phospho-sugar mutase [Pseudonocardia sp.]|nr:phospho-sugar mutase [Pseudonocardia sp.]
MRWIADDPDPDTRVELQRVLAAALTGDQEAVADLADRMAGTLRFGTAGLRGPVRAGPNGMNVAVVRRTTAGLAHWLCARGRAGAPVVVGRDARRGSEAFAAAAAGVLAGAGFAVRALPGPLPTPVLAFAVREIGAVAGVQITASHNPPADNGYKVYVDDGGQLAPPADTEIEAAIAAAPPAVSVPVGPPPGIVDVREAYLDRVAALPRGTARTLRIALTPLHGVGGETTVLALARAGFTDVHVVTAQAVPDAAFPTVAFPNPEEPGVTDALLATAERVGADLAVALDPDADRCALGVPTPAGWRMLTGDETGGLLGDHILRHGTGDRLVATTVVSSSMLRSIAAGYGVRFAETLTGFKWIVRAGAGLVYGYEEALGYCVDPDAVRDKDGVAAAVLAADLAATLKAGGSGLLERLDELATAHGVHATAGLPVRMAPAARDAVVERLRARPPEGWAADRPAPDVLVLRRRGSAASAGERGADPGREPTIETSERAVLRPSGTEPKLKAYLQVVEPVSGDLPVARAAADARLHALRAEVEAMIGGPGSGGGDHRV